MSAGAIIKRTLSDGCACRRWHACISSVSLHREENRLAHEQKPNNSFSRWKGSPFGEVGWLRDSGNRLAISCTTLLVRTSFDRVMAQHESTQRVSRATWPRPMPQFLRWRQKNLIWITLLSLSFVAHSLKPFSPVQLKIQFLQSGHSCYHGTFTGSTN